MAPNDEEPEQDTKMSIAGALRNYRSYRSTVNELNRLSQRELADLGISRADIRTIARRAVA